MNWRNSGKQKKKKIHYESQKCPRCGDNENMFFFDMGYRQDLKSKDPIEFMFKERRKPNRSVMNVEKPTIMCILGNNSASECRKCGKVLSNVNFMLECKKRQGTASRIKIKRIFHRFV